MTSSGSWARREADDSATAGGAAVLGRGFRPFFLASGIQAALGVGAWLAIWLGATRPPTWCAATSPAT